MTLGMKSLAALCLFVFGAPALGQSLSIAQVIENHLQEHLVPGLGAVLIKDGRVIYKAGHGFADREQKIAVDPDQTRFRWASIAKTMTAIAAVKAQSAGSLDLDKYIGDYYRQYAAPKYYRHQSRRVLLKQKDHQNITLRNLLGHTAGMQHYGNGQGDPTPPQSLRNFPQTNQGMEWALAYWSKHQLVNRPGSAFDYSTPGFNLAGVTLEHALGASFAEIIATYVAQPTGMMTLRPDYLWALSPHRAKGYRQLWKQYVPEEDNDVTWKLAAGGFVSTVSDLGLLAAALIGDKFLDAGEKKLLWTPGKLEDGSSTKYGLGFQAVVKADGREISHSGAQEKARSLMVLYPEKGLAIVLMTNASFGVALRDLAGALLQIIR